MSGGEVRGVQRGWRAGMAGPRGIGFDRKSQLAFGDGSRLAIPAKPMSTSNKAVIVRLYSEISRGNLDVIEELLSSDFVEHEVVPGIPPTRAGVRQMFDGMRAGFPDLEFVVEDMIAEGDKVFVRGTMRGTHRGVFMDIPATGRKVSVPVADFFRFSPGKVIEHWGVSDLGALRQQLGAA